MTLAKRLAELVLRHGSLRAVGRVLKIDHAYLSRLYHGEKKAPSAAVLKKLGLRRVVAYERNTGDSDK